MNVGLACVETEEDGAHEDGETKVHGDSDTVGDGIAIGFDPGALEEDERDDEGILLGKLHLDYVGTCFLRVFCFGDGGLDVVLDGESLWRASPSIMNMLDAGVDIVTFANNLGIDEVEEIFGGIDLKRHLIAMRTKVLSRRHWWAEVACLALGQETQSIKELEGCCGWLMN